MKRYVLVLVAVYDNGALTHVVLQQKGGKHPDMRCRNKLTLFGGSSTGELPDILHVRLEKQFRDTSTIDAIMAGIGDEPVFDREYTDEEADTAVFLCRMSLSELETHRAGFNNMSIILTAAELKVFLDLGDRFFLPEINGIISEALELGEFAQA